VTVTVSRDADNATITVSDSGPGIPPPDRERVFERFVLRDPARSATSGAGLGLSIARWIAEQHGGRLTVEENADGGSIFVVRLPMTHAQFR
jgi:signal transduction histidine kinase